ncbi:protein angel homolog 1 isoform X1 [Anolis carolinensis]|uniref:protein angel homolog 1 isoform X1 n=2 Tax=Anolis carolinensis TaxID=28377 RepID=UPI000462C242|nr:PREDICTED: protein angel homolog 1 isoform X1 [Anolis carolinensis]|eukprot:XP_008118933.1 PREDICTED: protein angel homolog 1 isoform X1 [Anolis carolinensis]
MLGTLLCYVLLPLTRLGRALHADALFTCRKNVLLAKSATTHIDNFSASVSGKPVSEEQQALLQQWLEEGAGEVHPHESASKPEKVSAVLATEWREGPELLMTSLSDLNISPESGDQEQPQQQYVDQTEVSPELQEFVETTLSNLPAEERDALGDNAIWTAVRTHAAPQIVDASPLSTEVWIEDPAVLAWSPAQESDVGSVEGGMWPFQNTGQFQPLPIEIPYHEILWRDWEDLSAQACIPELGSDGSSLFEFRVMSYNILAQDLIEQSPHLYMHCHPDILNWSYRLTNILQEIQHWDPDILCLQEIQENHFWEQLEPALTMMGFTCIYKRRTGRKTDGCAICYKQNMFQLISSNPVEFFRPGLDILNRDNVGLVLLLQPLLPEGLGDKAVSPLCVANTHVLYNPRRGDIKLAQMALLLAEIDKTAKMADGSYCPIILCGDLNSVPDSPLYKFIRNGQLYYHGMPAWKVSGQEELCQNLHQRKLLTPLWPSCLGITDNCQYATLCQSKKSDRRKYSRAFLLQFRYCDAACERPSGLVLLEGVTDAIPDCPAYWPKEPIVVNNSDSELFCSSYPGSIQHVLNLTSVYNHFLPTRGRPEITTMPMGVGATVDYIFYSAKPIKNDNLECPRLYQDGALKLLGRLSLLSEDILWSANGLPNPFYSSDHLCLLASFGLEISSF